MTDTPFGINFDSLMRDNQIVSALIPSFGDAPLALRIRGWDAGGIWVENQSLTDTVLRLLKKPQFPSTPIFFIPYSAIAWAVAMGDLPALSEKKLGL